MPCLTNSPRISFLCAVRSDWEGTAPISRVPMQITQSPFCVTAMSRTSKPSISRLLFFRMSSPLFCGTTRSISVEDLSFDTYLPSAVVRTLHLVLSIVNSTRNSSLTSKSVSPSDPRKQKESLPSCSLVARKTAPYEYVIPYSQFLII